MDDLFGAFLIVIVVVAIGFMIFLIGTGVGQHSLLKPFNTCLEHQVDIVKCAEINGLIYKKEK